MRLQRPTCQPTATTLLTSLFLLPSLTSAINLDCEQVVVNKASWNLKALGGPHSVSHLELHPPSTINTTYTLDLCKPLVRTKGAGDKECKSGTRICAIQHETHPDGKVEEDPLGVIPIAGEYSAGGGGGVLNPKWTRLSTSPSHSDSQKEGLRLEIGGGSYGPKKIKQKAIIEFLCIRPDATERKRDLLGVEEDDDEDDGDRSQEETDDGEGGTLKFIEYDDQLDPNVLRLEWKTKYACEDAVVGGGDKKSGGWGFFSWFFFILFLALIAYVLFSVWLNHNRYGARGWDLLPHGDTIRDVPYIMQDWFRKVVDTITGGHSRGGYSAV